MTLQDKKIQSLTVEEYFYLTENLDMVDSKQIKRGAEYLVINKKRKLFKTVQYIIQNELTETERDMVVDYWYKNFSISDIANKNTINISTVYRNLDRAKKKIEQTVKYILIYEENLLPMSAEELLSFCREDNIEN